ncbi:MAG: ABC transporter ATP-binding protein [bacterium]|jgi:ABC-2 type transport system ATP-binding protein
MGTDENVVEVEGVTKSYPSGFWRRRVRVLIDISFSVRRNEIVGFLGPNGAGKTTTIKILNGLATPDAGRISIFGEPIAGRRDHRRRIGYMPEQPYFYEYLTGEEFLVLCGRLTGMNGRDIRRKTGELLDRVGLSGAEGKSIRKYSKGMVQRLGLAQALLHEPELVILDEPMSGLDPMGRMEVRSLIHGLKKAGKTVFFSSHIIADVEALCDRVVMIDKGRKVAEGTVEELVGGEVQYVEVVFSPLPDPTAAAAMSVPAELGAVQGDTLVLRAKDHTEADRWVGRMKEAGIPLSSLLPVKRKLEDIYVERLGSRDGKVAGRDA